MKTFTVIVVAAALTGFGASAYAQDAKDIYLDKCATCHGPDGTGQTAKGKKLKMKGVKETSAKISEAEMVKIVTDGKGADMDSFGKQLTAAQVKAVVAYYRGLAK